MDAAALESIEIPPQNNFWHARAKYRSRHLHCNNHTVCFDVRAPLPVLLCLPRTVIAMSTDWDENLALSTIGNFTRDSYHAIVASVLRIPGSDIVIRYVKDSHQNDPIRTIIEVMLVIFLILFITGKTYHPDSNAVKLTEREVDELIAEWKPEELVPRATEVEQMDIEKIPTIIGSVGPKVKLATSNGKSVIHLASYNFLNLLGDEHLKSVSLKTLRNYGVGACGPPGFYGTQDCHMTMENDIATFLGTPACIVYAQAFGTVGSVIPAFAKRGDILVVDKGVNYAIQKGLQISRCTIKWYEHNDMEDLERVLAEIAKEQSRRRSALTRRFIVTEGIFENYGDMVDLPRIIELKLKYRYRLILDESWSFATIGASGRGVTEFYNIKASKVDMIIGSLTTSLCSGGGFCAASAEIVDHQRISGSSYVFSAALPAMMATQVSAGLEVIKGNPSMFSTLADNARHFRDIIDSSPYVFVEAWENSPMQHLRLRTVLGEEQEAKLLQEIVDDAVANGVLITRARQIKSDGIKGLGEVRPSLRICVTTGHSKKDIEKAAGVVKSSIARVCKAHGLASK